MTATCFSYVHVLHKKAAFIPDASIGVFSPQFYNKNTHQTDYAAPPPVLCFLSLCFHQIREQLRLDKFSLYFVFHAFQTRRMNILHCIHIAVCITILQRHFANANLSGFQVQNALRFLITYRQFEIRFLECCHLLTSFRFFSSLFLFSVFQLHTPA